MQHPKEKQTITGFRGVALAVVAGAALFFAACSDTSVDPPRGEDQPQLAQGSQEVSMDLLAKGLAIALADDDFRRQVFEDLRDSPFPQHALHLPSYLSGDRGQSIMAAIGGALGSETGAFASGMNSAENVALLVPSTWARLAWTGDAEGLVVFPIPEQLTTSGASLGGYAAGGEATQVPTFTPSPAPIMLVGPSETDFGLDPENRRASAPKNERPTIEDPGGPVIYVVEGCEDDPSGPECEGGGPAGNNTSVPGTTSCWSSSGDADTDGFVDACEFALAAAFAPELKINKNDGDETRETYWAVAPISSTEIRIFYALGYHRDTGGASGHFGDSEFILVEGSHRGGNTWRTERVFTSAHWGEAWPADQSAWTDGGSILYSYSRPLGPVVWVAKDKHANYKSKSACNGFPYTDTCNETYWVRSTEVLSNANIGRRYDNILNCVSSRIGGPTYPGQECFWQNGDFKGWYSASSGSTSYNTSLNFMFPY